MNLTAGMIAAELARMVNKDVENIGFLPALAGVGDHSACPEFEQYLRIAASLDYDRDYLLALAKVLDFEAYHLRFIESRGLVNDLLGADTERQRKLVNLMLPDIQRLEEEQLKSARHYCSIDEGDKVFVRIDIERVNRRGSYPAAGKATGILHDAVKTEKGKETVTLGIGPDFITFRATENAGFNVHEVLASLIENLPFAGVEGGGHEAAGTVKFVEAAKDDVLMIVDGYLEKIK
jgi:RecJ-like exonuclease